METNKYETIDDELFPPQGEMYALDDSTPVPIEIMPGVDMLWYKDLAKLDIPAPSWVVDTFIPDSSITIISAAPAQYKTWLAFDIAIKVANGEKLFEQFDTKQTKVLIVDEESGLGRARARLQKLGIDDNTPIAVASYNNFRLTESSAESVISYCSDLGIGLVIFDSLARIHVAEENSAKDMSAVMGNLKRLAQAYIAVIIIHHNRKPGLLGGGGANEMRGSGDILAACDVQVSLKSKAGSNIITVSQNKNRDAPNLKPYDLEVKSDENRLWFEYIGKATEKADKSEHTDKAILELLASSGPLSQAEIITALKAIGDVGGEKMVTNRLKALLSAEELTRTVGAKGKHLYELKRGQSNE